MATIFSKACGYAFRGLVEMAKSKNEQSWRVQVLAEKTVTPAPFLAKTFQLLVAGGILRSTKGRGGGFCLAKPASEIYLIEIVKVVDGSALTENCVLGFPNCDDKTPCPFHEHWALIRKPLLEVLCSQTLLDLSKNSNLLKA